VCGSRRPSGSRIGSRRWRASPSAWPNGHEQKPDLGDADARVVIESEDEVHCSILAEARRRGLTFATMPS
jgi:hypothetical protein